MHLIELLIGGMVERRHLGNETKANVTRESFLFCDSSITLVR